MEGPADTSATAMIGYGLIKAFKHGITIRQWQNTDGWDKERQVLSDKEVDINLEKIKSALIMSCKGGKVFHCSGECRGFSEYPQIYDAYPWSLGPAIRFLLYL